MQKQLLISLGREFGSGGHKIAQAIAEKLGIKYYDRNILDHMFGDNPALVEQLERYEEKHVHPLLNRHVRGYSNSIEENLAILEFDFIRERAESGESFVIVGRCGEAVLRDYPGHISLFVLSDMYDKVCRVRERCQSDEKDAINKILRHDRSRKKYHNMHSDTKWGDSRGYDLCVNASRLGLEGTTELLLYFIEQRREMM